MRIVIMMLGVLCLSLTMIHPRQNSGTSATNTPYVEREEKEFSFYPGGKVEIVSGVPGNISIVGWQRAFIRMEVEKIVYYRMPDNARDLLKEHPIRIRYSQTSASVRVPEPVRPGSVFEFNMAFYVPGEKTDLRVAMNRGDFSIESVNGWVEVSIVQGSLEARNTAGYFSAVTQKGDIYVEMSGTRWRGLEFAALTHHGSVDLRLPRDYSATLQLDTRNGSIVADYPPRIIDGEAEPLAIVTRKSAQMLKGSVGDGGPPIKLASHSGNIRLSLKE